MNIKYFPPVGTRKGEKISDSKQAKVSADNAKSDQTTSKDVFEQAARGTVDQLLSKQKMQESRTDVAREKLEPTADCEPGIRAIAKKLELVGNCITFRAELAGSCIPMKKLEPVADCEPMTQTLDELKQQQLISPEKKLAKPEK